MMIHSYTPLALSLIAGVLGSVWAQGKVIDDGPQHLNEMSSIGESLRNLGPHPLHILYVHGMDAMGAGDSRAFQEGICAFLKGCQVPAGPVDRDYADSGEFQNGAPPPAFDYMGKPVWSSTEQWSASAPFVDHYVLTRSGNAPVVVDEINWWPLVFPFKCRNIIPGEARLAGPDADLLNMCSNPTVQDAHHPGRFTAYQWLAPQEAASLKSMPHRGALANRLLKNNILDWGVSDAFLAVGSMRNLFREGMRKLFVKSARFRADGSKTNEWLQQLKNPQGIDRGFIVVSHSLGSYLVFSTLDMGEQDAGSNNASAGPQSGLAEKQEEDAAAQYILERTSLAYFFANQVPLLELATMEAAATSELTRAEADAPPKPAVALSKRMKRWSDLRQSFQRKRAGTEQSAAQPPQVLSFSDPSDLLTWRIPEIEGLKVDNLYVRNTWLHWLVANPAPAHRNYARNRNVLQIMMGP